LARRIMSLDKYALLLVYRSRYTELYSLPSTSVLTYTGESHIAGLDDHPLLMEKVELDQAIKRLPDDLRRVAVLRYVRGLTPSRVAKVLHCSRAWVWWKLDKLKELWSGESES
jgi:DNA-directed RNA polymerase specialized sigma24 family protein